ncbi:MAG: FAD-dependent oxidoreductase, partial [Planctomycetota bacterium]|nr:FAD-dependent oxidoreductase [Planctomycetota bacterium]
MHTKLLVLGGGPGGYAAAFLAADAGLEVTLVEQEPRLGGTCLLRGCIPSKALLHVAHVMSEARSLGSEWGVSYGAPQVDLAALRARKSLVIERMSAGLRQLANRRKVQVIQARGTFENSTTLRLEGENASIPNERFLTFDSCVVATGSQPAIPPSFAIDSPRVMDSTQALELDEIPARLLVVGGGYIGLEMATVYAQLGSQVSVVELTDGLLAGADRDLV